MEGLIYMNLTSLTLFCMLFNRIPSMAMLKMPMAIKEWPKRPFWALRPHLHGHNVHPVREHLKIAQ